MTIRIPEVIDRLDMLLSKASAAKVVMADRNAGQVARDLATDDYVRCVDQIVDDMLALRRAGVLARLRQPAFLGKGVR